MRQARIKPEETDCFVHAYNRAAGHLGDYPFQDAHKEFFINFLRKLARLYTVEPLAYQVMGNHFHLLLYVPAGLLSVEAAVERFHAYHEGKKLILATSPKAEELPSKLRDISSFMKDLQQGFTRWFNRSGAVPRRGHLWQERFKSTLLEGGRATWDCWKYIEMNPVRAHMVQDAADYRFSSYGAWCGKGDHPFVDSAVKLLLPRLQGLLPVMDMAGVHKELRKEFARFTAQEKKLEPAEIVRQIRSAEKQKFTTCLDRRVRYWVDGLVIGSDIFVRTIVGRARGQLAVQKRRLVRAVAMNEPLNDSALRPSAISARDMPPLYSFKQLREII